MDKTIEVNVSNRAAVLAAKDIDRLCQAGTGPASDACPEAVTIGSELYPIGNDSCVAGAALTVEAGAADNLTLWASLKFARPRDVLVVSTKACKDTSVCGDLLIGFARNCGVAAVVTDGRVRDRRGIGEAGLPVYAAGTSPRAPAKRGPGKIGHPIRLGDAEIRRDMVVICDADGIVAFDRRHLEATLERLEAVEVKEAWAAREISEKRKLPTWIEETLGEVRFVEGDHG